MFRSLLSLLLLSTSCIQAAPVVYLIGDSTVNNGTKGQKGWGQVIGEHFDPSLCKIENRARGGRSSRSYYSEGLWEAVRTALKPGDILIMQFGHNDGGSMEKSKGRASIKGNGDETREFIVSETGKKETVYSFGAYLRRYITDAQKAGATPVVCSLIPRNMWKDGKLLRSSADYAKWAEEAAATTGTVFIPLNDIVADKYDLMGADKVKAFFPRDHTHTNDAGAKFNAQMIKEALLQMKHPLITPLLKTSSE